MCPPATCGTISCVRPTVLIVDDHPAFRASATTLLQAEGFDVVGEAADGASALRAVTRLRPEIVLLDIQLPDLDGLAVAEQLAAVPNAPAIVLISSRDAAAYGPRIQTAPARGFIPKRRSLRRGARRPRRLSATVWRLGLVGLAGVVVGVIAELVGIGRASRSSGSRTWLSAGPSSAADSLPWRRRRAASAG